MTCTLLCCIIMLEAAIWWVNCDHNGMNVVSNNIQMAFKHCSTGIKTPSVYQENHTITPPPVWNVDRRYFWSTYSEIIPLQKCIFKLYFQVFSHCVLILLLATWCGLFVTYSPLMFFYTYAFPLRHDCLRTYDEQFTWIRFSFSLFPVL